MLSNFRQKAVFLLGLSLAGPAFGADLPAAKAPPPPPPAVFTWTGLYVGFNGGYTWAASRPITIASVNIYDKPYLSDRLFDFGPASAAGVAADVSARLNGFFFGGQLGYNWQFADRLIVGVEADVQGLGVRGGRGQNTLYEAGRLGTAQTSMKLDRDLEFLGTARGRLGYALTPTLMAYVTGGLAYGGANMSGAVSQTLRPGLLLSDTTRGDRFGILTGWTVGAGAEMALSRNLSAKLEYLFYDLGNLWINNGSLQHKALLTGEPFVADAIAAHTRYSGHVVRAGLNYRFDATMPETSGSAATPLFASPHFEPVAKPRFDNWKFMVMPYLWAINLNGTMTMRGETVDVNATLVDAVTRSSSFPLAFMGRAEAENGPFFAYGDMVWAQMRFDGSALSLRSPLPDLSVAASASGRLKTTIAIGEAGFGYELGRWKLSNAPDSFTAIDAYTGLRYVNMTVNLNAEIVAAAFSPLLDWSTSGGKSVLGTGTMWWMDPVIGLRMRHSFAPGSRFETRADIGGFGAGSKFSWQFYSGYSADFDYNNTRFTALVGYRALGMNFAKYVNGRENGMNQTIHGPVVGLGVKF
jgi:opacity protein-like surface antigen